MTLNPVNVQDDLLCAIELGELPRVKRLMSGCGMDLNTVLQSPFRHENATVLGTAALEGQVKIIYYYEPCITMVITIFSY